jgi:hypothetical protein
VWRVTSRRTLVIVVLFFFPSAEILGWLVWGFLFSSWTKEYKTTVEEFSLFYQIERIKKTAFSFSFVIENVTNDKRTGHLFEVSRSHDHYNRMVWSAVILIWKERIVLCPVKVYIYTRLSYVCKRGTRWVQEVDVCKQKRVPSGGATKLFLMGVFQDKPTFY